MAVHQFKKKVVVDYRDPSGQYLPVSIESISTGATDDFDLFTKAGEQFFIVKPKGNKLNLEMLTKLKKTNPYLYIKAEDRDTYYARFDNQLSRMFRDTRLSPNEKAAVLTDWTVEIIDQLFKDPSHPESVQQAKSATEHFVRFISERNQAFLELVELRDHDHYTYSHSVGVASYSIALAIAQGYKDEDLVNVGLAGLLHDLGKSMIDPKIINKDGPLNSDEWSQMKKHPLYGAEILSRHKDLDPLIALAAEGHHENLSGTGYPRGVEAAKLDPLISIISMADAYSALTTKRSYSTPRDAVTALKLMKESIPKKFGADMFKSFVVMFLNESNRKKVA
ncbi:HD domain-containing protein [bacterium]|nr:HD domain-containing protein [bacterium]